MRAYFFIFLFKQNNLIQLCLAAVEFGERDITFNKSPGYYILVTWDHTFQLLTLENKNRGKGRDKNFNGNAWFRSTYVHAWFMFRLTCVRDSCLDLPAWLMLVGHLNWVGGHRTFKTKMSNSFCYQREYEWKKRGTSTSYFKFSSHIA